MKIDLPADVQRILKALEDRGYEAFAVGGCVRDTLMGKTPNDWDITTSAKPEEIKRIFMKTVDTGIKHGTVTVIVDGAGYEVTTYRVDGPYIDGRHPSKVSFTLSLRDDLKRRDFTINAMAYNERTGIRDFFYGMDDLRNKMIRAVGSPDRRYGEDALRMMRAIRFAAQLGFSMDVETYNAIKRCAGLIKKVSMERIQMELTKTLLSDAPECVKAFQSTGLFIEILPEINGVLSSKNMAKTCTLLKMVDPTPTMRYAALLSTLDPEQARQTMKRLKMDNNTTDAVCNIVANLSKPQETIKENETSVRRAIYELGEKLLVDLFAIEEADIKTRESATGLEMRARRNHLKTVRRLYDEILERGDCVHVKDLAVTGGDLVDRGRSGPEIGEILNWLMGIVIENPKLNEKATLLAMVDNY